MQPTTVTVTGSEFFQVLAANLEIAIGPIMMRVKLQNQLLSIFARIRVGPGPIEQLLLLSSDCDQI